MRNCSSFVPHMQLQLFVKTAHNMDLDLDKSWSYLGHAYKHSALRWKQKQLSK